MNVVMVHGIWDTGRIYRRMEAYLSEKGHECFAPDLKPANAANGLVELAEQLKDYINDHTSSKEPIALVGFSMGSLIARHYIQHLGGRARTNKFFTISGPHHGTLTAHVWPGKAARDMRFSSPFLNNLNSDLQAFEGIEVHSYRTPFDLMILPSTSSKLSWAENHIIPASFHHLMVVQEKLFRHMARKLAA